jgi:(E)-4-hydroxy-3-methylbut-2-enyl-diphosphate synthase
MLPVAKQVDEYLQTIKKPIKVAVMGCIVNGPGEASEADVGVAGGKDTAVLFAKGKVVKTVAATEIFPELKKMIDEF